uniref:tRNA pseudouridine(55) synthase n=1 Tax=Timema monikensis TaxID=170555 RepID=A0A7R9HMW7_9NEOP|nr:unnamed protein product [Timema monikensis]
MRGRIMKYVNSVPKHSTGNIRFISSGREDVDVRCLRQGRPFACVLLNAEETTVLPAELKELGEHVNQKHPEIRVSDLQLVSKEDLVHLKSGEEKKRKVYSALCVSRTPIKPSALAKICELKDLELKQKMPIRVLHRRPANCRSRIIYSMSYSMVCGNRTSSAFPGNGGEKCQCLAHSTDDARPCLFVMTFETQAGTYVKEFVHGDLGRTTPNLRTLLNAEVDIIALDVTRIDLDWPPQVK